MKLRAPNDESPLAVDRSRRRVLRYGVQALGVIAAGQLLQACRHNDDFDAPSLAVTPRKLVESGVENLLVPEGFTARVIARTGEAVIPGADFRWHPAPDGGATFAVEGGGWIYVSNSEMDNGKGGVSAVRFHATGNIVDAYSILEGTHRNCSGGPTPWNTWLSCEEVDDGHVWECDPFGRNAPRELPALGTFMHEAVAVDPRTSQLYLTEDRRQGRFYRFTPASVSNGVPDLETGTLEVAKVGTDGHVSWLPIADPSATAIETRYQQAESTPFDGGEGAWHDNGTVYFTTKHDNRVWAYHITSERLTVIYNDSLYADPLLTGVDNVTGSQQGVIYVAEDGGNMQIVGIDPEQRIFPVVQLLNHPYSEVTGPAFDPSGTRLYFSSQRGPRGVASDGMTYEVTGPFN